MERRAERERKAPEPTPLGYRPLYRQVKDLLLGRLSDGSSQPGQMLPSEPEIAADLGVSPGTVRKALDEMTAENLLFRRQGRGTFVARHDDERILFQFFRLVSDTGERRQPESQVLAVSSAAADETAAKGLNIAKGEPVIAIERVRSLAEQPCIHEWIVLPGRLFPRFESREELPNNLYQLYSVKYGLTIARATERLRAVAASPRQAELLDVAVEQPLLAIDRVAFGLDGAPVEWRLSLCRTDRFHYRSDLG